MSIPAHPKGPQITYQVQVVAIFRDATHGSAMLQN